MIILKFLRRPKNIVLAGVFSTLTSSGGQLESSESSLMIVIVSWGAVLIFGQLPQVELDWATKMAGAAGINEIDGRYH